MKSWSRIPIVLAALALLMCAGCIRLGVDVAVAPDQSSSARLLVGLDTSLGDMGAAGNPFAELKQSAVGARWTVRDYTEGTWQMHEAVGQAGPGEPLFPDGGDTPALRVQIAHRRLSTRYDITLIAPPPPTSDVAQPPAAAEDKPADQPAPADMPDMGKLAESFMSGIEVRFALSGPGRVVATTGQAVGPGQAEWKLGLTELGEKKTTGLDFRLTTELPNWLNIGRLADQLVMRGGPADAGSKLAAALARGLLPNPPASAAAADKLAAADYQRLLEIIGRLDGAVPAEVTDTILKQARLNDEGVSSAAIAAAHARLMKADVGELARQATIGALTGALTGK